VVSLDFELHWGMRDRSSALPQELQSELVRSRELVSRIATELSERSVRATWAIVGFLFASSREELETFLPAVRPRYSRAGLDPYSEPLGEDEVKDPLHMAGSVVRQLATIEGQEIGSHTFSHYYCLEPGQNETALRADLRAAKAIAKHLGIDVRSLVLPRNQWNPAYADAVRDEGFSCYRGAQSSWGHRPAASGGLNLPRRTARLFESYLGGAPPPTTSWKEINEPSGLCNVPASAFLRPYSPGRRWLEPLRISRMKSGLRDAAKRSRVFHLWWHPHNFVQNTSQNFDLLRDLLDDYARLAGSEGMRSINMGDVPQMLGTVGL